jgi:hypothetical protein
MILPIILKYHFLFIQKMTTTKGWVILTMSLSSVIIILIIILSTTSFNKNVRISDDNNTFTLLSDNDALPLQICGTSRNEPCVFIKPSLLACENECENLNQICNDFTFDFSTQTMKIVNEKTKFKSPGTNLFIRN